MLLGSTQLSDRRQENSGLEGAAERFVRARTRSILLVEDNAAHAALIRRSLSDWEVEHSTRGSTALQMFSKDPGRIVLLDLTLPDENGLELLERFFSVDPLASVIIVTSLELVSTCAEAMRKGAVDYVVKGDPQETSVKLRDAVERAYAQRLLRSQEALIAEAKVAELVRAERLEAIELIVRTVCHEVNNPLSGVVALSQLLGEKTKSLDGDVRRLADGILHSAQEVARVVQKLHGTQDISKEFGGKTLLNLQAEGAESNETKR